MRQRKNVLNMLPAEITAFRAAVQALQNSTDPVCNYNHLAQIHVNSCVHNYELFLPWHRAFILDYENALRQVSGQDVTLPYWDWIGAPAIPDIFMSPPLAHGRDPGGPDQRFPTRTEVDTALRMSDFYLFGGTELVPGFPTQPGQMDNLHGYVHLWVGGDMADIYTFRSAFDPIFWTHHSNVDRLWTRWQHAFGNAGPVDTTTFLPGLDTQRTAGDVLDIGPNGLAYEYVEAAFDIPLNKGLFQPREQFNLDICCVRTEFTRAEVRFVNVRQARGHALPGAIDVVLPEMRVPPRVSLFGLHSMHHKMQDPGAIKDHAVSISPIADVTDAVLKAKERTRPIDIEFRLIGAPGTHAEACGISVDRLQLVLLA